jgi:hypothetical protein
LGRVRLIDSLDWCGVNMKGASMKHLLVVLLLACSPFVGGGAAHAQTPSSQSSQPAAGYQIAAGHVVFRFDRTAYANVTRSDNGEWLRMSDVAIRNVSVAGDFNGWSTDAWPMSEVQDGAYELKKELRVLSGRKNWQFKFVVNGAYWVEPPMSAPNRIASGTWGENRSYNLVLSVP